MFISASFSNTGYLVSFITSLICLYTSHTIDEKNTTTPLKVFIISLVNVIVNIYIKLTIIKVLTATVLNFSRCVYVK